MHVVSGVLGWSMYDGVAFTSPECRELALLTQWEKKKDEKSKEKSRLWLVMRRNSDSCVYHDGQSS